MAQKLGEAYIQVNADLSSLGPQLQLATNQVNTGLQSMALNMQSAESMSKKLFTVVKYGALAAGVAMVAASRQGQMLGDAFGALNQAVVDLTIGPVLERIANAIALLAKNMSQLGFLEGFDKTFSTETEVTIVAIAGGIMGALVPALMALRIQLATLIPLWWGMIAPLLPFIAAGAAVAVTAYLIWKYWDQLVAFLSTAWNWIWTTAVSIFNNIVNFFKKWGMTLLVVFGGPIGILLAIIIHNWDAIKKWTIQAWNGIVSFLTSVWNRIKSAASPVFNPIKNVILSVWNSLKSGTSDIWNAIKSAIGGAWDWIKNKATSVWSSIYNTIAGWVKKAASAMKPIISIANKAITGINRLTGSKIPSIPMPGLAKGGIVTAPTMALVGEGRYHEAVLPLSDKTFGALAEGITSRMNGGGGTVVNVYPQKAEIDEYDLANILRRQQWAMGV